MNFPPVWERVSEQNQLIALFQNDERKVKKLRVTPSATDSFGVMFTLSDRTLVTQVLALGPCSSPKCISELSRIDEERESCLGLRLFSKHVQMKN